MSALLEQLAPFALLGILGAAHCAGMCGGFAIAVASKAAGSLGSPAPSGRARAARLLGHQLAYVSGKALTYAVLGLVLATGTQAVARATAHTAVEETIGLEPHAFLAWTRGATAWLAGLTMIVFGLGMLGVPLRLPRNQRADTRPRFQRLTALVRGARSLPGSTGALATGLATGFLPCGLSWSAFALAAAHPPHVAFLGLLTFGLATAPALLLTAAGWHGLRAHHRTLAARLAGPLLLAFGTFTILRGLPTTPAAQVLPDCCSSNS